MDIRSYRIILVVLGIMWMCLVLVHMQTLGENIRLGIELANCSIGKSAFINVSGVVLH